jgi:hypothetical protein
MAEAGQILVPTLSCFYGVAGMNKDSRPRQWTPALVRLAEHNLEEAGRTPRSRPRGRGRHRARSRLAALLEAAIELVRMVEHGMSARAALTSATATGARALGLDRVLGTVEPGKLADLVVVDGDPLADPAVLRDRDRIWLVLQLGEPVAGRALEARPIN